jgi:integrase
MLKKHLLPPFGAAPKNDGWGWRSSRVFEAARSLRGAGETSTNSRGYSRYGGKVVAQLMGHTNVDSTLNVYTPVLDGSFRQAVEKVGSTNERLRRSRAKVKGQTSKARKQPQLTDPYLVTGSVLYATA